MFLIFTTMVEGGIAPVNKTEFTELFRTIWKTPHILRLAMTAGIGGLLFGYDTGTLYSLTSSFFLFLLNLVLSL